MRIAIVLAAWVWTASAFGGVHVVDPQGAPGAPLLDAALAAAVDGDVILVRAGDYSKSPQGGYTLPPKAITLVGDGPGPVSLPGMKVTGAPGGRATVLRGLRFQGSWPGDYPAGLDIGPMKGAVLVEECSVRGANSVYLPASHGGPAILIAVPGLWLTDANDLVVLRSEVRGGNGVDSIVDAATGKITRTSAGRQAVDSYESSWLAIDSTFLGGNAGSNVLGLAAGMHSGDFDGGAGIQYSSNHGDGFLIGCTTQGGSNGLYLTAGMGKPGAGVPKVPGEGSLWTRDSTYAPGVPLGGAPPAVGLGSIFNVFDLPAPHRRLRLPGPLREGEATLLQIEGIPGDLPVLFIGAQVAKSGTFQWVTDKYQGNWMLPPFPHPTILTLPLPPITAADGVLALPITVPHLPPGVEATRLFLQLGILSSDGATLEGPESAILLDASF